MPENEPEGPVGAPGTPAPAPAPAPTAGADPDPDPDPDEGATSNARSSSSVEIVGGGAAAAAGASEAEAASASLVSGRDSDLTVEGTFISVSDPVPLVSTAGVAAVSDTPRGGPSVLMSSC